MKGIILAGGSNTRLYPLTPILSKHVLSVYDKPMVYYPLSTLMLAGVRDIVIVSNPEHIGTYMKLLGDGHQWGITLSYIPQAKPEGIAQAFIVAKNYIQNHPTCLILGDNIFYGAELPKFLRNVVQENRSGATIFAYNVRDPQRFGVVTVNQQHKAISLEEKPKNPKSNLAVTGLYFYDQHVTEYAVNLKKSSRGELEITDLNKIYLKQQQLHVERLGRGIAWLDTGTPEALIEASQFIYTLEKRQGFKVACLEEIAYRMGYVDDKILRYWLNDMPKNEYHQYCVEMLNKDC